MDITRIVVDFDEALRDGKTPNPADFLGRLDEGLPRVDLLVELISSELSHHQGAAGVLAGRLAEFPELGSSPDLVLRLIRQEYLERLRTGQDPGMNEYERRFPDYASQIGAYLCDAKRSFMGYSPSTVPPFAADSGASWESPPTDTTGQAQKQFAHASLGPPGFEIVGELGRGGMGVVYKAWQIGLKRIVALKMILAGPHAGNQERARFRTEAEAVAQLQHPNIVQIHEIGDHQGEPYFALEFVDGGSLARKLLRQPQDSRVAARLVESLSRAIHHAHQKGVIHRDLKPANVLLARKPGDDAANETDPPLEAFEPKVTDFGLAKRLDADGGQTASGAVLGTPSYMAPEQAAGRVEELGPLTDVYALGAILYEMLTGCPPFEADTQLETLQKVLAEDPRPPSSLRPGLHRDLETICLTALAKEPARRYSSALTLAQDLERFQAGESIVARPEGRARKAWRRVRRHPVMATLVTAACLVLLIVGYVTYREVRARQVTALVQSLQPGLDSPETSKAYLEQMEASIAELDRLAPQEAATIRERLYRGYATAVRQRMAEPLTPENLSTIEDALRPLESRRPALAAALWKDLGERQSNWKPLFDASAGSRDDLKRVFGSARVRAVDDHFWLQRERGMRPEAVVPTLVACSGNAELSAVFGAPWETASQLGLVLNAADGSGYAFLLRASEPASGGRWKGTLPAVRSFREAREAGRIVSLQIVREGKVVSQRGLKAAELSGDSLRMVARREGDRLSVKVQNLKPLQFRDGFPLGSARRGVFGLYWPADVPLRGLRASQKALASRPNPLEIGDDLYAQGQYPNARRAYLEQAATGGAGEFVQEAEYKAALCLAGQKQYDDAAVEFRRLSARTGERWPLLARFQLVMLSLRQNRLRDANENLEGLFVAVSNVFPGADSRDGLQQLTALVSDAEIREIVQSTLKKYQGLEALRLAVPFDSAYLNLLERLTALGEHLRFQPQEEFFIKFALVWAYRFAGRPREALGVAGDLLRQRRDAAQQTGQYLNLVHLNCWLLRENGDPRSALRVLDEHLYQGPGTYREHSALLLTERARIHAVLGDSAAAEKDLDEFFRLVPVECLSYPYYAGAWLMRGFIEEDRGRHDRAVEAWRQGLYKVYVRRKALPVSGLFTLGLLGSALGQGPVLAISALAAAKVRLDAPEPAPDLFGTTDIDAVVKGWFLASLADDLVDDDVGTALSLLRPGDPKFLIGMYQRFVLRAFLPAAGWRGIWQNPRGRRYARQMAFQTIAVHKALHDPLVLVASEIIRRGAFSGRPTPDQERVIGEQVELGYSIYFGGKLDFKQIEAQLLPMLAVWKGNNPDLKVWEQVENQLEPAFRGGIAYLFGRRYLTVGKPGQAGALFRRTVANVPRDSRLHRLAKAELAALEAMRHWKP
jgi:serine/threonine protein kinase